MNTTLLYLYNVLLNKQYLYGCLPVVVDSSMGRIVLGVVEAIVARIKLLLCCMPLYMYVL